LGVFAASGVSFVVEQAFGYRLVVFLRHRDYGVEVSTGLPNARLSTIGRGPGKLSVARSSVPSDDIANRSTVFGPADPEVKPCPLPRTAKRL
jgi:hypothetical protein